MTSVANAEVIKRLVILIADGRAYSRALLRSMLQQLDVKRIHDANDGAAALEAISNVNPDVMLLDWDLPVLNVRQVLSMVRTSVNIPNPDLPIIVISSSGHSAYVHQAIELGAQQFMVRPISPKMLQQRLVGIVMEARRVARAYKHGAENTRLRREAQS